MTGPGRRAQLAVAAGLLAALMLGLALGSRFDSGDDTASPAVLNHIAAKNQEAAITSAARMKAESEATTAAADARIEAEEAAEKPRTDESVDGER